MYGLKVTDVEVEELQTIPARIFLRQYFLDYLEDFRMPHCTLYLEFPNRTQLFCLEDYVFFVVYSNHKIRDYMHFCFFFGENELFPLR